MLSGGRPLRLRTRPCSESEVFAPAIVKALEEEGVVVHLLRVGSLMLHLHKGSVAVYVGPKP